MVATMFGQDKAVDFYRIADVFYFFSVCLYG